MKTWYQLRMYWKHLFLSRHRGGHGVHSPLLFDLITKVIEEENPYYCYEDIEADLSEEKAQVLSAGAAQLMFRLLHYWHADEWLTLCPLPDARRNAYLAEAARQAHNPDLAAKFQAIASSASRMAMVVDLSAYQAKQLEDLYQRVQQTLQAARQENKAVMLLLLHPHRCAAYRQIWRQCKQDLHAAIVMDCYDLAILMDASTLPAFHSKIVYR